MMPYIVVAVLVLASLATGTTQASYGRLNSYLIARVNDDDVGSNIEAASRWLKEQSSRRLPFLSPAPVPDLEKFTALKRVIDDTKCDQAAYEIMRANEDAVGLNRLVTNEMVTRRVDKVMLEIFKNHAERCSTNYPIIWREKKDRLDIYTVVDRGDVVRRIDKVMQKIFEDHAVKCQQVYPVRYLEKLQQLDSVVAARVANIAHTILEKGQARVAVKLYYNPEYLFGEYIAREFSIEDCVSHDYLWLAIKYSAEGDPNAKYLYKIPDELTGKRVVRTDKIKELTQKYLIEPCKSYVAHFGPDIFVPARLDAEFHYVDDVKKDSSRDYYIGWVSFMICKGLIQERDITTAIVIKSVEKPIN